MRTWGKALLAAGLAVVLAGAASAQQPRGFGMGMGMGGAAQLLNNKSVQEELKLSEEQITKAREISEKSRAKMTEMRGELQGLSFEEIGAKMRPIAEEANKAAAEILKPEQQKRLRQIELQQRGVGAFTDTKVQEALKLTDDQKDQIKTIAADVQKDTGEIMRGMRDAFGDQEKMAEIRKKMESVRKEGLEKVTSLLTADQKTSWKEQLGAPFEMKMEPQRRPGGEGQPGGQRRRPGAEKKKDKDKDK